MYTLNFLIKIWRKMLFKFECHFDVINVFPYFFVSWEPRLCFPPSITFQCGWLLFHAGCLYRFNY